MIACLAVPYFAAAVERRDEMALAQTSLVVGGRPWEPRPLFGFSHEAARQGVRPGMPLRQAHLLSPASHFLPAAPSRYLDATGEVVDVLVDFTHLVVPEELWQPPLDGKHTLPAGARTLPARYTVDLEGLPSQEALPLVQEMGRAVRRHTHLEPAVGLAAASFAAQVAAALARPNCVRPVAAGAERGFLADRPVTFLPLEQEMARRLHLLGIRTLGELAALPPAALREQFGSDVLPLYRLARGEAGARPAPQPPAAPEQVSRRFEPPLLAWLALENVLGQVAAELAGRLQAAGLAGRTLRLLLETEDRAPQPLFLPLRRPTAGAGRLAQAAQALLQTATVTAGVTALTVALGDLEPAVARQLSLFAPQAPPPGDATLPLVMARHETAQFLRPVLLDGAHPLPERRFALHPPA